MSSQVNNVQALSAGQKIATTKSSEKTVEGKKEDLNAIIVYDNSKDIDMGTKLERTSGVTTKVEGSGNTTNVTINMGGAVGAAGVNAATGAAATAPVRHNPPPTKGGGSGPVTKKPTPEPSHPTETKKPAPETTVPPKAPEAPPISRIEAQARAEQVAKASWGPGTDDQKFYNALTVDTDDIDNRAWLAPKDLQLVDKALKSKSYAPPLVADKHPGGIVAYVKAEFASELKDQGSFYGQKMRELLKICNQNGIN